MINASQSFIDAVAQSSRRFRLRMFDGSTEIAGSVRSAKIHLGSTGPDAFAIGAVYSAYAEIVLDGRETTLEGKELRLDIGVLTDAANDTYSYMTMGYFTALAPAATKYRTTFTGCGRIVSKLAVTDFVAPATQTLQAVADAITTQTGVSVVFDSGIDTSLVIDTPITGNCRDALTRLAECVMGYATETNAGAVRIARFAVTPTTTRDAADMITLPAITDLNFEILGVRAVTNTGVYETSSAANVQIESNYITEDIFTEFAPGLVGIEYRPGTVSLALGDPRIEASDVLSVAVDSDVYVVPCFSITHTFDGGLQTSIVTPAVQNVGKVTGTLSQAVEDAKKKAEQAAEDADDAKKVATSYLSRDASGFMVANMTGAMIYTPGTVPTGVINAFISASAFQVRDGQTVLATYGTEAAIYTKDGTELAHFGYASGTSASGGTSVKPYYTLGRRASGSSIGNWSFAAGLNSEASGGISTALGAWTVASGNYSFAAGSTCEATGDVSVAMGGFSKAEAQYSVAMGCGAEAKEFASMAVGYYTIANDAGQFVCGSCNVEDTNAEYAAIIGGGSGPETQNRLTIYGVTWDGDTHFGINTAAASGTVDGDLVQAITALGWNADVIDSTKKMISMKKLLTKILTRI